MSYERIHKPAERLGEHFGRIALDYFGVTGGRKAFPLLSILPQQGDSVRKSFRVIRLDDTQILIRNKVIRHPCATRRDDGLARRKGVENDGLPRTIRSVRYVRILRHYYDQPSSRIQVPDLGKRPVILYRDMRRNRHIRRDVFVSGNYHKGVADLFCRFEKRPVIAAGIAADAYDKVFFARNAGTLEEWRIHPEWDTHEVFAWDAEPDKVFEL